MVSSNCAVSNSKKLRFTKEQEACGLLSNLGPKAPSSKIPLMGLTFFRVINKFIQNIKQMK